jgi:hypothetical protein
MFTDISWTTYLTVIGFATLAWYSLLAIFHYYGDIKDFLSGKKGQHFNPLYDSFDDPDGIPADTLDYVTAKGSFDEPALQDFEIIEELIERVKALIAETIEKQTPKEGFFTLLKKLLKEYPILLKSQFRPSVSEFISGECEQQGLEGISLEEVETLWKA